MIFLKKQYNNKLFLGIDLGTTYSLAATIKKEKITFLLDQEKRYLLPSVVNYKKNDILVGWDAQKKIIDDPFNTISSSKRLIGRSIDFIKNKFPILPYIIKENKNGGITFHTDTGFITPTDVSSDILKELKKKSEIFFNQEIDASIITVPAYFNNIQRKETKKAALLANINLIRLLNEPTAAAVGYGLQMHKQGIIVVYDLGGGTFDVSILKLNEGIFEVLATSGDSNLGGDDFDLSLAHYIYNKSNCSNKCNDFFNSSLLEISKDIKIKLTKHEKVKVNFFNWTGYITRDEFNLIIRNFVQKTLSICIELLKEIELSVENIKTVVMVGGSTRVPLVYQEVKKFFKKTPLTSINPDQVVAMGAAIQANMLLGRKISKSKRILLLDVIPLSLGIEVMGGFVEKIIFCNTSIPISKTKEFTTFKDNQTTILIHILQGESEFVKDCVSLSRFVLRDIPPKKSGMVRILVTFEIDTDGLIHVKALEKYSKKEKNIQIDNSIVFNNEHISKKLKTKLIDSQKDYFFRVKEEKKIESKHIIDLINKALKEDQKLLDLKELKKIKNQQKILQKSIDEDDFFSMKLHLKKLEDIGKNFFSLRLRNAITSSSIKNILDEST